MLFRKKIQTCSFLLLLGWLGACKVAPPPQLPAINEMPARFEGQTDTASMADLNWREFFKDPQLLRLLDAATSQNLDLLAATQRIEAARANFMLRKGALLPSVQATAIADAASLNNSLLRGTFQDSENTRGVQQEYFLGLQSSWEVDLWGKLKSRREAAYARFLATQKGQHLLKTALVAEVAQLYYELLALDNELEVVHRNIDLQEVAVEMIKVQKMGGRATELAVQQFTAQLLATRVLEEDIERRIVLVENQLNLLLGRYPEPVEREIKLSQQAQPQMLEAGVPSAMLLRRPDIRQAELELLAAKADVRAARAAFLPSLVISPYVGVSAVNAVLLFQPEALALGILGSLSAPIFQKNRLKANYQVSVAQNKEAVYNYQQTMLNAYQEVVASLQSRQAYQNMFTLKEQEVEVLQNAVSTSNDMFMTGYASYLEVITAQKRVLEAELELASLRKNLYLTQVQLYRALGGGWQAK